MPNYLDSVCPVCNKPFADGDDIVVCPECGTPHHRACWLKEGRCALEARHADGYTWSAPQPDAAEVVCSRCGTANPAGSATCRVCGYPIAARSQQSAAHETDGGFARMIDSQRAGDRGAPGGGYNEILADGITVGEFSEFVGPGSRSFLRKFLAITQRNAVTFNLSAFFFTFFYCFYRRMYKLGALVMLIKGVVYVPTCYMYTRLMLDYWSTGEIVTTGAFYRLDNTNLALTVTNIVFLVVSAVLGVFFDRLYLRYCTAAIKQRKAADCYSSATGSVSTASTPCRRGGVDRSAVVAVIVLLFILLMVAASIMSRQYYGG